MSHEPICCPLCLDIARYSACGDPECPRRLTQPTQADVVRAEAWGLSCHLDTFVYGAGTILPDKLRSALLAIAINLDDFANERPLE